MEILKELFGFPSEVLLILLKELELYNTYYGFENFCTLFDGAMKYIFGAFIYVLFLTPGGLLKWRKNRYYEYEDEDGED
jgi:hypothetical protein